ncbi:hypothetical protein K8R43_03295 [archaeon]|nr:hypothetical protein [archaeon]
MPKRSNWLKLKVEELFTVKGKKKHGSGDGKEQPRLIEPTLNLELAVVVIEIVLILYLILSFAGIVEPF